MRKSRSLPGAGINKQLVFPRIADMGPHNTATIRTLEGMGAFYRTGRDWQRNYVLRESQCVMNILETQRDSDQVEYTRQEDYVKINFWLGGKHTTILDGLGQYDHDRPEVFITAGPLEMIKLDLYPRAARLASVALCLRREFFTTHMGLDPEQMPGPLQTLFKSDAFSHSFCRFAMTPDLVDAARSIFTAPPTVLRQPLYGHAKTVELVCLLFDAIRSGAGDRHNRARGRREARLHEARDFLMAHYSQQLTLDQIARTVGLNKMTLTSGFRQLFGASVYDYLKKIRMEQAYQLLQDPEHSIDEISDAVGYRYACNFSTAFHTYYGCTPQSIRLKRS